MGKCYILQLRKKRYCQPAHYHFLLFFLLPLLRYIWLTFVTGVSLSDMMKEMAAAAAAGAATAAAAVVAAALLWERDNLL